MWTVIILFVAGIVMLISEFFIPGLIVGTIGLILIGASCVYAWMQYPEQGLIIMVAELIGVAASVAGGMYMMTNTKLGSRIVLTTRQDTAEGWTIPTQNPALVGKTGTVYTRLRPAGKIVVDGERIDAVSNGTFIDKGTPVRVIDVEGVRVVVEPAEASDGGEDA